MNITIHIREIRKTRGWSGEELADRTGISVSTIRYIENGHGVPAIATLCLIAKALGCTLDELVTF